MPEAQVSAIRRSPSTYQRYSLWDIEQFFRTLKKQGLQIEDSQVETADCLIKLAAVAARAAVIIMQLTQARDGTSSLDAPIVFSPAEIATLEAVNASYSRPRGNPHPHLSLAWAAWIIARLGGWPFDRLRRVLFGPTSGAHHLQTRPPNPANHGKGMGTS